MSLLDHVDENMIIRLVSTLSRARGILEGLGHPDPYIERVCDETLATLCPDSPQGKGQ